MSHTRCDLYIFSHGDGGVHGTLRRLLPSWRVPVATIWSKRVGILCGEDVIQVTSWLHSCVTDTPVIIQIYSLFHEVGPGWNLFFGLSVLFILDEQMFRYVFHAKLVNVCKLEVSSYSWKT